MAAVIFWALALLTIGAAVMTVIARNILHAAIALAFAFMGVSGLYLFLHADFVAATQLIVYVGGIIVLVIFAVMFSAHIQDDTGEAGGRPLAYAGAGLVGLFVIACLVLTARHLGSDLVKIGMAPKDSAKTEAQFRDSSLVERHPAIQPPKYHAVAESAKPAALPDAPAKTAAPTADDAAMATNPVNEFAPATKSIGALLLGKYLLAFEAVSVLLLAVVVAAVVLVRKETMREGGN